MKCKITRTQQHSLLFGCLCLLLSIVNHMPCTCIICKLGVRVSVLCPPQITLLVSWWYSRRLACIYACMLYILMYANVWVLCDVCLKSCRLQHSVSHVSPVLASVVLGREMRWQRNLNGDFLAAVNYVGEFAARYMRFTHVWIVWVVSVPPHNMRTLTTHDRRCCCFHDDVGTGESNKMCLFRMQPTLVCWLSCLPLEVVAWQ